MTENIRTCPICNNGAHFRLTKENVEYFQCYNCKTVFSDALDNENKIGGVAEIERNTQQNNIRIDRVKILSAGMKPEDVHILDFGCGTGYLIKDFKKEGFNCDGYDAYNDEFSNLPEHNKYHIITAIEVCEHFSTPFAEYDVMYRSLLPNGIILAETSFTNVADEEGIELEDFFYISPLAGHSTIHSHHGFDLLLALKGFVPRQHFNRHARVFQKR